MLSVIIAERIYVSLGIYCFSFQRLGPEVCSDFEVTDRYITEVTSGPCVLHIARPTQGAHDEMKGVVIHISMNARL
jgi:hypothetical protein